MLSCALQDDDFILLMGYCKTKKEMFTHNNNNLFQSVGFAHFIGYISPEVIVFNNKNTLTAFGSLLTYFIGENNPPGYRRSMSMTMPCVPSLHLNRHKPVAVKSTFPMQYLNKVGQQGVAR